MTKARNIILLSSLILFSTSACDRNKIPENAPKAISILANDEEKQNIDLKVGDIFNLTVKITPEDAVLNGVTWKTSDESIVTVDEGGKVLAKATGTAIVSVTSTEYSYLTSSVFVNVSESVHQDGVGSGFTKDDPVFKGNEGKDEPLEIYFIEMRQQYEDCIYIKKGNVDILIDGGEAFDGEYASQFMSEKMGDNRLDLVIATHGDSDHINGLPNALKNIKHISTIIDYGGIQNSAYSRAKQKFIEEGTVYHTAYDCANLTNGITSRYYLTSEFYVDILNTGCYCKNDESNSSNPYSVAALFTYKDFKFFTAGDLTSSSEESLMANVDLPNVTLYKASHHGSHGSNTQNFMNKLNPKGVAISAAISRDSYGVKEPSKPKPSWGNLGATSGHPAEAAVERIYKIPNIMANRRVYWNAVNGTMCFSTHGENDFQFAGSPTMKGYYDIEKTGGKGVWNETLQDFENKVTGEENLKFSETKAFKFRGYDKFLA